MKSLKLTFLPWPFADMPFFNFPQKSRTLGLLGKIEGPCFGLTIGFLCEATVLLATGFADGGLEVSC